MSGEVPEQPAVNKKTGQVFEKRLLQKHIENGGKCPMTNEPIEEDDIIELKGVFGRLMSFAHNHGCFRKQSSKAAPS